MTTTDILIARTIAEENALARDHASLRVVRSGVQVTSDIWVGELPDADQIVDACCPKGYNFAPTRQFGYYYAIARKDPPNPKEYSWDPDQRLRRAIVFSRLVHPNPTGYSFCARVVRRSDESIERIARQFPGVPALGGSINRPWLTPQEWKTVGSLLASWKSSYAKKCLRFCEALWHLEKAATERYLNQRWVLIATAIEALIGEWMPQGRTQQKRIGRGKCFRQGLQKLGEDCGLPVDANEADGAWRRRSSVVHGAGLPPIPEHQGQRPDALYDKVERILGASLRRMIELDEFATNFANNTSVRAWLKS
jgi:hypothetical protein